jgi:maltose alpha-D-glucosyltransferase/alpha-amylase
MEGTHPELEMSRFLTETAKFPHIPQLAGVAEYADTQGRHSTLAILERYAPNQGDAWHTTLDFLERVLDECRTRHEPPGEGWHSAYASLMKTLGQRTAEFHRALARPDEAGAFGSEPISPEDLVDWVKKVRHEMELMFERLDAALPTLPEADWHSAGRLLAARPRLYRRIVRASGVRPDAMKTRCHGNYHLGQVWLVNNDFLIANYGGEPGRSWAERRRKHTPLQDVACMLLSLSQAGATALDHVAGDSAEVNSALQRHVDDWERVARRAFFRSYRKAMTGHPSYPADAATSEALMTLFLAEQAISQVSDALVRRATGVGSAMRRLLQVAQR